MCRPARAWNVAAPISLVGWRLSRMAGRADTRAISSQRLWFTNSALVGPYNPPVRKAVRLRHKRESVVAKRYSVLCGDVVHGAVHLYLWSFPPRSERGATAYLGDLTMGDGCPG